MPASSRFSCLRDCVGPLVVALVVFFAVVAALDPVGDFPNRPQGPGLTLDESYNVEQGARLAYGLEALALGVEDIGWRELFGDEHELGPKPEYGHHLPDHPPLGRLALGIVHNFVHAIDPPDSGANQIAIVSARVASALAFAVTILLTGYIATRWYGRTAGIISSMSLLLMPRVFGHAHLAALETMIGLAYATAVFAVADRWSAQYSVSDGKKSVPWKTACWTGIVFGLALLTKIQAVLIPVPLALWAFIHSRQRALLPLVIWSVAALAVFFALWPWLWFDPIAHFREYLGRTTERQSIYVWYFGTRYADVDVPWHYPWVLFLTTVPLGLQILGAYGLVGGERRAWREARGQLVLACILFPLVVFSLPRVAVYDGERLFLVVFPLWAVFIGKGGASLCAALAKRLSPKIAFAIATVFFVAQSWGAFATHPCYLSYYNLLVGGLRGAHRLGLDATYWRDSVTRELLDSVVEQVPKGATVILVPVLNNPELHALAEQSPILRRHEVQLRRWDQVPAPQRRYLLLFRREADIPPIVTELLPKAKLLAEVRRQGVQLAEIYELKP
jgi:hypothetical protein